MTLPKQKQTSGKNMFRKSQQNLALHIELMKIASWEMQQARVSKGGAAKLGHIH